MAKKQRKALSALPKSDDLDVSQASTSNSRRTLHRKLLHNLLINPSVTRKKSTLVRKEIRNKPLEESRQILADWEKKFAKSRGKISGSQMAAINKLPLHIKKQVLALSRTYATLGRKDASIDPGRLTFNREMIKARGEEERDKRKKRQSKAEFERDLDAQADKIKTGLGWLLARNEIRKRKLKEGSGGIMKEEIDKGKAERIRNAVSDRHGNWDFKSGKFTDKGKNLAKRAVRMIAKRGSPEVENLKDKISDRHNTWDFKRGNFTTKGLKMINKAKGMYHVKEDPDRETMMNYIKKTSEDSYGCTDHDPKHYNKMAREYVMGKYKDGYLKKEAAMQQMGMIGVPKDEILKMFGVEAELDESNDREPIRSGRPPWKKKPGDYEKHGKEPRSSRAANFLRMVRDARASSKNKPKKVNEAKDGGYSWDTHDYLHGLDTGKIKHKPAFSAHIPARGYFNSEKEYRALSRKEAGTHKGVDRKNKAGTLTSIGNKTRNKRSEALKKLFKEASKSNQEMIKKHWGKGDWKGKKTYVKGEIKKKGEYVGDKAVLSPGHAEREFRNMRVKPLFYKQDWYGGPYSKKDSIK